MAMIIMVEILGMILGALVWFFRTNPNLGNTFIKEIFDYKKTKLFLEHKGKLYEKENDDDEGEVKEEICKKKKR